jgi:clan AA aspartic protease
MGKVIERARLTNVFEPDKFIEIDALIDTGATMVVLPYDIVNKLGLRKVCEVKVRYANNKVEMKPVYRAVIIEILGREGTFDVIGEEEGSQSLIGQVVLEVLDLVVDPRTKKLLPNPASPETPMIDIFMATSPKSGHTAVLRLAQIPLRGTSHVRKTLSAIGGKRRCKTSRID